MTIRSPTLWTVIAATVDDLGRGEGDDFGLVETVALAGAEPSPVGGGAPFGHSVIVTMAMTRARTSTPAAIRPRRGSAVDSGASPAFGAPSSPCAPVPMGGAVAHGSAAFKAPQAAQKRVDPSLVARQL
jgi:hypothetical protein